MRNLRELVETAREEELPGLVGQLREAELLAEMRLRATPARVEPTTSVDDDEDNLTYEDAAKFLKVSVSYVKIQVRQGKIPHIKMPATDKAGRARESKMVRLRRSDLVDFRDKYMVGLELALGKNRG